MKKIILILVVLIISGLAFINSVNATSINVANLYVVGKCEQLLTYKGVPVEVSYVQYNNNGVEYPAYCMDKNKPRSWNTRL